MRRDDEPIPIAPDAAPKPTRRSPAARPGKSRRTCPNCGYDLRGQRLGARCPECGALSINHDRHHGPRLLLHSGRVAVFSVLAVLVPLAALALSAFGCVLFGTIGAHFDDRLVFAFPAASLPLCGFGLLLVSSRLTHPDEREDAAARRVRVALGVASALMLAHGAVLTKAFVELRKPTPVTGSLDVALTTGVCLAIVAAIAFFVLVAARLRGLERWLTGDAEGSLFAGASGLLVLGPVLLIGVLNAAWSLLQLPIVRTAWRVDRVIIFLATLDIAWRSWRALRFAMHSLRHAGEFTDRMERAEEEREERLGDIVREQRRH